ncbi:class I SAM-dependent methyltransferase [Sediminibacterium roseum]|uniref:Class I SAM-dependent methyltransferase n=1 Tax=Sediminibacterium roseum TaxID=1978412 RepID=A0ABW9ZRG3_9BACT|nr:class I SAM-dependent methyltransferase [Sediminibacterium roseum]NCI49057.1 class I SAM-dependent methyltransferase [Sediminibacterium roseum]
MSKKKKTRYQDYVIKDGRLVGRFEEMYRDHTDPWHQSSREIFSSEKAVGINLIQRLQRNMYIQKAVELGCGFGEYTARIARTGLQTHGLDISETAIAKARERHAGMLSTGRLNFSVARFDDFDFLASYKPDIIVMPEITWYVLDDLAGFIQFLKEKLPDTFLLHMLMTYELGVQAYGKNYFTNLEEILLFFNMKYLESGKVNLITGGSRTWFLGTNNEQYYQKWLKEAEQ